MLSRRLRSLDPEERGVLIQRPTPLPGVPAILGLARGFGTAPWLDRAPRHQLVDQFLL